MLKRNHPYPVMDALTREDKDRLGLDPGKVYAPWSSCGIGARGVKAVWDGKQARSPKKGEWYLSGSVIEAYRAPVDLNSQYHIAILVSESKAPTLAKSHWDEDANFSVADWKGEVENDDTRLGYAEWVEHQREASN